jgi:hypothetical protein
MSSWSAAVLSAGNGDCLRFSAPIPKSNKRLKLAGKGPVGGSSKAGNLHSAAEGLLHAFGYAASNASSAREIILLRF